MVIGKIHRTLAHKFAIMLSKCLPLDSAVNV